MKIGGITDIHERGTTDLETIHIQRLYSFLAIDKLRARLFPDAISL
jgi:hypothetical protein